MRDEGEVREVPLDRCVQDLLRPRVAEWRAVLVQEVHQFFGDEPFMEEREEKKTESQERHMSILVASRVANF